MFAESCASRWLLDSEKRGKLSFDEVKVTTPDEEEIVLGLRGSKVTWLGDAMSPRLSFTEVDLEMSSPHSRALSKGRKGAFRVTIKVSARDIEKSAWVRKFLENLLTKIFRVLDSSSERKLEKFEARFKDDDTVVLEALANDGLGFSIKSKIDVEDGAATFRDPLLKINSRPFLLRPSVAGGAPLPFGIIEYLGSAYLSTVSVDASRGNCRLSNIKTNGSLLELTLTSGPSSQANAEKNVLFFRRRKKHFDMAKQNMNHLLLARKQQKRKTTHLFGGEGPPLEKKTKEVPSPTSSVLTTEWRVDWKSLEATFAGDAAHPLRHNYVLGDKWPWLLNPQNAAPLPVYAAFAFLAFSLSALALPDALFRFASGLCARGATLLKSLGSISKRFIEVAAAPAVFLAMRQQKHRSFFSHRRHLATAKAAA